MTSERPWFGARVYAFLFRFLGPAQLGAEHEPATAAPDPQFACPACGHPIDEHTWMVDEGRRRMQCPRPAAGPATHPSPH